MSLKTLVSARLSSFLLDAGRQRRRRAAAERRRQRRGAPHEVLVFHQIDDPYSHLLAQALLELQQRYDVALRVRLVPAPDEWAAPEGDRLRAWAVDDARALARRSGFAFDGRRPPSPEEVRRANRRAAALVRPSGDVLDGGALPALIDIGTDLWSGTAASEGSGPMVAPPDVEASDRHVDAVLAAGAVVRARLGHYAGGMCWYAGEWTWGIDRLACLEERLGELGARRGAPGRFEAPATARIYAQPALLEEPPAAPAPGTRPPRLHFFLSFRSPYTYLATARVIELARAAGADLRLRFVLPMVMRGLPVRRSKRFYILRDAAREARRLGVPFAPVADPVGRAVERGYSLLPWAIEEGRGADYCLSFMTHVWSRGVDAAAERGLRRIVEAAGLDWADARHRLDDPAWRPVAEANRRELLDLGLWGVPSFRVGDLAVWGQDRLWRVEEALRRAGPDASSAGVAPPGGVPHRA